MRTFMGTLLHARDSQQQHTEYRFSYLHSLHFLSVQEDPPFRKREQYGCRTKRVEDLCIDVSYLVTVSHIRELTVSLLSS